ncbi:MAG: FHA domain-containing protein [Coprothermobacter sp.]|nr:FHA domain-containing protein [Coprothermobacter sp.]
MFNIFVLALMAIIAGIAIRNFYVIFSQKSKITKTTRVNKPKKSFANLFLPKDQHIIIEDYEKTFGREDFLGVLLPDDLVFIGKEHFKITRMDDGFYIEDLDTKNGTTINGNEIKGSGKIKLENRDEILVAKTLPIKYLENKMS